ncbi:MAG TPA: hypothetical protein VFD27_20235 [Chthoniobacteraceae bacterium]|nr:hypothetical protein [Chthoniobacteraceae bacterium]
MPSTAAPNSSSSWLIFALLTVVSWGLYGVLLHTGRSAMPAGAEIGNASLKAFLWVGVAYFVVAIVGPVIVLKARGTNWSMTGSGITWSFIAGTAGAVGAFTLILALGAAAATMKGEAPSAVMPIVFGGAPVVNAIVAMMVHPPDGGFKSLPLPFIIGIVLAASGGFLVAKFAPSSRGVAPKSAAVTHGGPAPEKAK